MNKFKKKILKESSSQNIFISIFLIILSLLVASIIILFFNKNPIDAYKNLLQGAGLLPKVNYAGSKSMLTDFLSLLDFMTPMIFAALAVSIALKAGLFNIGVSGQMLFAGYMATIIVGYSQISPFVAKPLVLIVGVVGGMIAGGAIGFLKYKFNINEVVSSIMFNYIIQYVLSYFIHTKYMNPVSRQSNYIMDGARLTLKDIEFMGLKMDIPLGFILAIIVALALRRFMNKSAKGYEIKAVGSNPDGARYAGINVGKTMILSMAISGALSGLAGVTYFLGYFSSIQPRMLPTMGFDSIAVALLGNLNSFGIIIASLIISIITKGATYMSSMSGVRHEIASVITGLILLFSATGAYMKNKLRLKAIENKNDQEVDE